MYHLRYLEYEYFLDFGDILVDSESQSVTVSIVEGHDVEFEISREIVKNGPVISKMQYLRPGASGQNCGYRYNPTSAPVIFAFGPNNCGSLYCDPTNTPNTVNYANGQAWGALVENVTGFVVSRGYSYQIFVAGAMDIEGSWNTYVNTRAWLNGLLNTAPYKPFYNYGNCDCPNTYNPNGLFHHDWNYSRTYEVSFSIGFLGM